MKKKNGQHSRKVGSDAEAAKSFASKNDFGASESDPIERDYASRTTQHRDPGGGSIRAGDDGSRTSGVGGTEGGPGNSSGGDLDPDFTGVGSEGAGIAQSFPDRGDNTTKPGKPSQ